MTRLPSRFDDSASRFADQSSKCAGKKRFSKLAHAEAALDQMRYGKKRLGELEDMRIYKCSYCGGGFHLGNRRS